MHINRCTAIFSITLKNMFFPFSKPILEYVIKVEYQSKQTLCNCSEAIDRRLKRLDITRSLAQPTTGHWQCGNFADVIRSKAVKESGWTCPLGLRLEAQQFPCQPGKAPRCMEGEGLDVEFFCQVFFSLR